MAGGDLDIVLFFFGLAVTLFVAAMSQAGWKHWTLITALFVLAGMSAATAVAWPWTKDLSPLISGYIKQVANSPVSWFAVLVMTLLVAMLLRWRPPVQPSPNQLFETPTLRPNTLRDALEISLGEGDPYTELRIDGGGVATRIIRLKLHNSGNGLLTACRVVLAATSPPLPHQHTGVLYSNESLSPGEYVFFQLATYIEKADTASEVRDYVVVCRAYDAELENHATWVSMPARVPPPTADSPLLLSIRAQARECRPAEIQCKLWVDRPSRRLRVEVV